MLSLITPANAATPARTPSSMGASFAGGFAAVARDRAMEQVVAAAAAAADAFYARPRSLGAVTHAAAQAESALQQPTCQKKFAHTTRIAAVGGGALGPHPARDPV